MKSALLTLSDIEGKTVKTALMESCDEAMLIVFTDGEYLSLSAEGEEDETYIELRIKPRQNDFEPVVLHELGIITEVELKAELETKAEKLAKQAESLRLNRLAQYEKLKQEFG